MKKVMSILICVILIIGTTVPCFAKDEQCTCGEPPIIYVAALGSGAVIRDEGTDAETKLFRPETKDVIKQFLPIVPAAARLIADKNYDAFGDVLIECINKVFGDLTLDGNGNSKPNVTSEVCHPESGEHGLDKSFYFGYDFRLDPVENAQKLHTYIQEVKEITHHDTVRFRASSMGGVVAMSYLKLYGSADIETIIFQCCPLQGTAVAGELYNGKLESNKDALLRYGSQALPALDNDPLAGLLYVLIEALEVTGVWDMLLNVADDLINNLQDRIYSETLIPIFSTLPGIWSFVPDEYYESAKTYMKLDENTQSGLIDKLDFYHYQVQSNAKNILNAAKSSGTTVYLLAGYNMQRTPLVTAYKATSDGTVDTKYASCGATCADLGETLPLDYQSRDERFVSPDRMIDASTCILPENTWFVKDMLHCKIHDGHMELYNWMFKSENQMTVFDNEKYPQFLQNDVVNQKFTAVKAYENDVVRMWDIVSNSTSVYNVLKLIITVLQSISVSI
ncbi:MAG: hypothetical protein KBT46_01850 [Ruminococcus sp.]|nr:hypothetical protein [Candidatus Copronaster equi]